jgi:hypothetical protein
MKAILIKREDGYNLAIEQPQGRLLEATCSPSQQLILNKSGVSTKYKLSKQNCDEIFGVVDVEKLAHEFSQNLPQNLRGRSNLYAIIGFDAGFNKAMELNKDKQFTLEDVRMAIAYGEKHRDMDAGKVPYQTFVEFIPSLQQPTEIEVEIEMELHPTNHASGLELTGNKLMDVAILENYQPKLDSNGYLILKQL